MTKQLSAAGMISSLRIPFLIALSALAVAAFAGCAASGPKSGASSLDGGPSSYINNEKVERSIEQSSRQQRRQRVVASCPALVKIKKGGSFTCVIATGRGDGKFRVTMKDEKGNVHYEAVSH